ncbi:hypothetical protein [Haloactinospora alba]|uniref:hypothetical protein n=1 Tax=Haloactinospora alba TaxID=405555 RepID=UPI0011539904|nr:hypothetical protein [Haloactinospora alba]
MSTDFRIVPPDADVADAIDAGYRPAAATVRSLASGYWPVLVRCSPPAGHGPTEQSPALAETLGLVSVYAWLGARVFATSHPRAVRDVLDTVASISGARPPAVTRRGLA